MLLVSLKESDAKTVTLNTSIRALCTKQELGTQEDLGPISDFPSYSLSKMDNVGNLSEPQNPLVQSKNKYIH